MRVVIAEDRALLRDGLTPLLASSGFKVVAVLDNARARSTVLAGGESAVGYLLKGRVANVSAFVETVHTMAGGG